MLRIAIVDDDAQYRMELVRFLERYGHQHNLAFQTKEYPDGDELLDRYAGNFDIIFLDVLMKYMDGIKTAERIRSMDSETVIIFISSTPQYAMKGYLVDAFDYILKPLVYTDFAARLDRALAKIQRRSQKFLSIPVKSGVQKIEEGEIYYVEVRNHDLMFHTASGTFESKGTLAEMEQRLDSRCFFRCNKCYLVNLDQIQGIRGCDVLVGGDSLQVSRAKKKELMDALNNFLSENGV